MGEEEGERRGGGGAGVWECRWRGAMMEMKSVADRAMHVRTD
jgi:hypothetical protein